MKTIYSLQEFRKAVLEIAKGVNETYTSLQIEVENDGKIIFKAYIPTASWQFGNTMEECLAKLVKAVANVKDNIDVEIEMPEPENLQPEPTVKEENEVINDLPF